MRDIQKMCRICLSQGSRDIFESSNIANMLQRDDLSRIAEKLRYVTMLKVSPSENLPQQICDLCIVQLNVSYNFKRLALKNDFQIRNYMIENGISLTKEDDHMETTTALEIHQIQHNVIRTNRYRSIVAPEIRRNSTQSSVSGTSTMIINGQSETNGNTGNNFVTPRPMVRPIQIKTEPDDDDGAKESSPMTSSPSTASEPASIVTVHSSNGSTQNRQPPMIVINGIVNNDSFSKTPTAAPLSVKLGRPKKTSNRVAEKEKGVSESSRVIRKRNVVQEARKLRTAAKKVVKESKRASPRKQKQKENKTVNKVKPKTVKFVVAKKTEKKPVKQANNQPKPRGRPPANKQNFKATLKNKQQKGKKRS